MLTFPTMAGDSTLSLRSPDSFSMYTRATSESPLIITDLGPPPFITSFPLTVTFSSVTSPSPTLGAIQRLSTILLLMTSPAFSTRRSPGPTNIGWSSELDELDIALFDTAAIMALVTVAFGLTVLSGYPTNRPSLTAAAK